MTRPRLLACALLLMAAAHGGPARGAEAAAATDGWTFTSAVYLWTAGIDGTMAAFGAPAADASASIGEVLDRLDAGFMGVGEMRRGRFSLAGDVFWVRLSEEKGSAVGPIPARVTVTTESSMWTGVAGYALVRGETATLDAFAGARLWSVDNQLRFGSGPLEGAAARDDATWLDPLVGLKGLARFGGRYFVRGWAVVGGFGAGSDSMWDVMGAVGCRVTDTFSIAVAYRMLSVDYRDDGFAYDIEQSGPMLGVVLEF